MESQRRMIIDTLWEENREFVMEYMGNKYSEEVTLKRIADARNEAAKEYRERILQLEQEAESLREELDRSNALLESARNTPPAAAAEVPEGPTELETVPKVRRVSEEGIHCRLFDRTRYFVHISYDRRTMFVQPHDFGKTVCINGELVLSNFGKLVPFVGECDLR